MMKNHLTVFTFLTVITIGNAAIAADDTTMPKLGNMSIRPYIGVEYNYIGADVTNYTADFDSNGTNDFSGDLFADRYSALVPNVGVRIGKYARLEVGYLRSTEEDQSLIGTDFLAGTVGKTETRITGWNVDANGYLPLAEKLEAIGSVGFGHYKAKTKVNGTIVAGGFVLGSDSASDDDSDTALRLGAGLQYSFTDNISLRGMVRYMDVKFEDSGDTLADGAWAGAVGVSYTF